jgi:hypothetical protein
MKKLFITALISLVSISGHAESTGKIEAFNENQLVVYKDSNLDKQSESNFNELGLNFVLPEYSSNIIKRESSDKEIRKEATQSLSSLCYEASTFLNVKMADCLSGDITEYSKNYIIYKYTLMNTP